MHTIERVREFHLAFHHPVEERLVVPSAKTRLLRFRLLFEELMEFGRAIGIEHICKLEQEEFERELKGTLNQFAIDETHEVDMVEAADALGDIDYVCAGANLCFGFPAEEVAAEIHRANMSKLGADGLPVQDAFGKIVKSSNYRAPNVSDVLTRNLNAEPDLTLAEWMLVVRNHHDNVEFTHEDGAGSTYGDKGDWTAHVGPEMQDDVVGVFSLENQHAEVQVDGATVVVKAI